jgi:N-6 DNA Methylase
MTHEEVRAESRRRLQIAVIKRCLDGSLPFKLKNTRELAIAGKEIVELSHKTRDRNKGYMDVANVAFQHFGLPFWEGYWHRDENFMYQLLKYEEWSWKDLARTWHGHWHYFRSEMTRPVADFLLQLANWSKEKTLCDLSMGDGDILIRAAKLLDGQAALKGQFLGLGPATDLATLRVFLETWTVGGLVASQDCPLGKSKNFNMGDFPLFDSVVTSFPHSTPVKAASELRSYSPALRKLGLSGKPVHTGDYGYLWAAYNQLKPNGTAVIAVSEKTIFGPDSKRQFKRLFNQGAVEALIELPYIFPVIGTNIHIVVLKHGEKNRPVKFLKPFDCHSEIFGPSPMVASGLALKAFNATSDITPGDWQIVLDAYNGKISPKWAKTVVPNLKKDKLLRFEDQ